MYTPCPGNAAVALALMLGSVGATGAATGAQAQRRIDTDLSAGRPIVIHVVVALCDNENQGVVPVPAALGDGQDPRANLYWGARHGVKAHLSRQGWKEVPVRKPGDERILERVLFFREVRRAERDAPVYLLADAWDGAEIASALRRFLSMAAGDDAERVQLAGGTSATGIDAGGRAHLVVYVGHNGLMDFDVPRGAARAEQGPVSSSVVLACASKPYFLDRLEAAGSHPLLLTTGLMAPEAYTLDAVVRTWITGGGSEEVREAAARAYARYQKCGLTVARRLFWGAR